MDESKSVFCSPNAIKLVRGARVHTFFPVLSLSLKETPSYRFAKLSTNHYYLLSIEIIFHNKLYLENVLTIQNYITVIKFLETSCWILWL